MAAVITPAALPAEAAAPVSAPLSPNQRAWLRFKRNRLGKWSLWVFCAMLVLSGLAEVLSNDKPLVARYNGDLYFPMLNNPPEVQFGGDFRTATDWSDPFITAQFKKPGNWTLRPPNRHSATSIEYFAKPPNPTRWPESLMYLQVNRKPPSAGIWNGGSWRTVSARTS